MADGEDLPHHASGPRATSSPGRLALTFRFWRSDSASHGPLDAGFPSAECSRATRSLHDRRQRGNRRLNHAIHMAAVTQIHRRHSDGRASATSGRAIVISGLTVMISLAGLFLSGISIFSGLAIGTITVVGLSVLGSVTVLPALLAWLGRFTDRGRIPLSAAAAPPPASHACGQRSCAASSATPASGAAPQLSPCSPSPALLSESAPATRDCTSCPPASR
jgi:hypothetical protein